MKIGPKLILVIVLLIIVSVAISGLVYYFVAKQSIEKRVEAQLETAAVLKENHINDLIEGRIEDIEAVVGEKAFVDNLRGVLKANDSQEADGIYRENVKQLLKERLVYKEKFFEFFVLNLDGKIIISTDEAQEGKFKSAEDYFIEGKEETSFQNFYYDIELQQPIIIIATPIKDNGGKVIGILAGRLNLDRISDVMVERSGLGETGETYLINKFNLLVSKSRFIEGIEFKKVVHTEGAKDCLEGINGYGYYNNYRDIPVVGLYKWVPEREICLLAEIEQGEAFKPIKELRNIVTVVCLGLIILAVILGFILARTITRPIRKLAVTAQVIAGGDLTKRAEIESRDEIGQLAMSFNKMVEDLLSAKKEEEKRRKEFETKNVELEKINEKLEQMNKLMVGRELRMAELKKEIEELKRKSGEA